MKKVIFILMMFIVCLSGQAYSNSQYAADNSWLTLDIFHQSRALPLGDAFVRFPFNPGFQAGYHRVWLGKGSLTGGTVIQGGYSEFDRLFWAMNLGGGIEATWRTRNGFYSNYAIRLEYERLFTGNNHFVLEKGRYQQKTDNGRGYLRIAPLDLSFGYAPEVLRKMGIIPAIRFAWALDLPLYNGDEPPAWSYTQLGFSINWMIGGQR